MGHPEPSERPESHVDVAVVGAGFGGLSSALALAERGQRVALFERLTYPGGCASTFTRRGRTFESGATIMGGLAPNMLFGKWMKRYRWPLTVGSKAPRVELRTGAHVLPIEGDRDALMEHFCAISGAPQAALRAFFAEQRRIADILWPLLETPTLHPPVTWRNAHRFLPVAPRLLAVLKWVARPLSDVVAHFGLSDFEPLRHYLDALCTITVQCDSTRAEAPLALSAMDYYFRGTAHIEGGVGELAWAIAGQVAALSGAVHYGDGVKRVERDGDEWVLTSRRRRVRARHVVFNVLPQVALRLLGAARGEMPALDAVVLHVEESWGAAMLYLTADAPANTPAAAHHLQLVGDALAPFSEGNHIFVSISGADEVARAPGGRRTLTISTHTSVNALRELDDAGRAARVEAVQSRMRAVLAQRAPLWDAAIVESMSASPRTFERFTARTHGYVGGAPRTVGWHHYAQLSPMSLPEGLHLVGDSVPPGQSAYACALGGLRVAARITKGGAKPVVRSRSSAAVGVADVLF